MVKLWKQICSWLRKCVHYYYQTPEDSWFYRYEISAESTGSGGQACLHVVGNSCVKFSLLGTI